MKRIISFLLAVVVMFGVVFTGAVSVSAASSLVASDDCIKVLKAEEGFSKYPYYDYAQYTVGYGSRCPDDMYEYYKANGITEAEAEVLLRNHLTSIERAINQDIIDKYKLNMTQNQFDALVMFSYNCGTGWAYDTSGTFHTAIVTGKTGNDVVRAFALWCIAGNSVKTFLLRRRLCEANMYLNGIYSQTPPEDYGYVIYEPNGGTVSPKSQGYIAGQGVKPYSVPTYAGYTFDGWYTERIGGTKVETLEKSHNEKTLYAHWKDASGNSPDQEEAEYPVKITVTANDVRLRKGPGTNYSIIGYAGKGDQYTITETAYGSGYRWGNYGTGWICLQYTNYDTAVVEQKPVTPPETTVPETTVPETTVPETTVPETTVPETTVPETTVPETTVPPTTTPPTTTPPATTPSKVTGTVTGNDLRVRSGPSTGYSIVGYLNKGAKVEILEQKTAGTMIWGRIAKGWISMSYVKLDQQSTTTTPSTSATITGTVTGNDLRIRSGAGTNYGIVGYLNKGDKVSITEKKTVGSTTWGKMSKGWISMAYVKVDTQSGTPSTPSTPTTPTTPSAPAAVTGTVTGNDLRVRSGPGTSYAVKTYLKKGAKVTITEQKTVGSTTWGKISSGWVSMDYVKVDSQSSSGTTATAQTKTVTASCLLIRSGAGTSYKVVGYLYRGAKVSITETKTVSGVSWGKTAKGWICLKYVK